MRRTTRVALLVLALVASPSAVAQPAVAPSPPVAAAPLPASTTVLDDFEDPSGWSAHPADGVELQIDSDTGVRGRALRLDFRFLGGGGYAVARKAFAVDLPENYAFSFRIRGAAPSNHLEFKLIDSSGENVWWSVRRDVQFRRQWDRVTIKKRQIAFAWGPAGGGEIRHVAAIEIAITAGSGGTGTVWLDELELCPLPPPGAKPPEPVATASSAATGHGAGLVLDGDPATSWWSTRGDEVPWMELDLGEAREYGGLILDWVAGRHGSDYAVEASDDGTEWRLLRAVEGGNGGRDYICSPESESRYVRLRILRHPGPEGAAIAAVALQPLEWSATRTAFFQAIAGDAPRGSYPRGMSGEQAYWTVVGVDCDAREALLGEDGGLETGRGRFSIEPFLFVDGKLIDWSQVESRQSLDRGRLPIPSVWWSAGALDLGITAFGVGEPGASSTLIRYEVRNRTAGRLRAGLYLALRPFQVNPPAQFLATPGGTAPIHDLAFDGRTVRVDGQTAVIALRGPARSGASTFDGGDIVADWLCRGELPPQTRVQDSFGAASGALAFQLDLVPGGQEIVDLLVPLYPESPLAQVPGDDAARTWVERRLEECRSAWEAKLGRTVIQLPDSAAPVVQSLLSQLAYILINRAGPAIQPGTRSYARSWIRDGALTSSALLRLGHAEAVREFIEWFAPHQYRNGKIPCVVDSRGADPVPEHDSSGEFVFLVAEYYRYTGDRVLLEEMYPRVVRAVAYLDSLRQERRSAEFRAPDQLEFYGLLPPSISHEGYSSKPMHSYWDDFWALAGWRDAAFLAAEIGREPEAQRFAAIHAEFGQDLVASVEATMRRHAIDYVPGCADLGDFDATSTTIALSPTGAAAILPQAALRRTFEKYWEFFRARRSGAPWEAFTPYEIRNLGAFVRLGWRDRAQELLDFFLSSERPPEWRQWPEVVWHDARAPHFLGDLPHTWVGSDYVRSVLDMLAYEREGDGALVIAAGVPMAWLRPAPGVVVRHLPTRHGPLGYTMRLVGDAVEVRIEAGLRVPRGGVVVRAPLAGLVRTATVNGQPIAPGPENDIVVRALPAVILLRP